MLNIDAGLKSAIITIDDIPEDRYAFIQGDRKIIVTLSEASNALLGENTVYTHTLTDDQKLGQTQMLIISAYQILMILDQKHLSLRRLL
ncbi:MAG: hypothetical protein CM15mP127_04000 [Gammaproteobacteria bacterium]|nr:MAG: hypothetical protein CM15mP127_04000 [Gammaproteobacteria bacterium]